MPCAVDHIKEQIWRVVKLLPASMWGGVVGIGSIRSLESLGNLGSKAINCLKICTGSKNATRQCVIGG